MSEIIIKIRCQKCKMDGEGCSRCGGYGIIASLEEACVKCSRKAWFRPGAYTSYPGKKFVSFDGLPLVDLIPGRKCFECYAKEIGKDPESILDHWE
jgi:hypothetical protein